MTRKQCLLSPPFAFFKDVFLKVWKFNFFCHFTDLFPFKQRIALALLYLGYSGQICVSVRGLTTASAETALIFIMGEEPWEETLLGQKPSNLQNSSLGNFYIQWEQSKISMLRIKYHSYHHKVGKRSHRSAGLHVCFLSCLQKKKKNLPAF